LQNVFDVRPRLFVAARHDGRSISSTLLTTRDAGADEAEALLGKILAASVGVGEVRVSSVNDNISWLCTTLSDDSLDEVIDGLASLDENL